MSIFDSPHPIQDILAFPLTDEKLSVALSQAADQLIAKVPRWMTKLSELSISVGSYRSNPIVVLVASSAIETASRPLFQPLKEHCDSPARPLLYISAIFFIIQGPVNWSDVSTVPLFKSIPSPLSSVLHVSSPLFDLIFIALVRK